MPTISIFYGIVIRMYRELKNRGVKDILVICTDGLTGINEAIGAELG